MMKKLELLFVTSFAFMLFAGCGCGPLERGKEGEAVSPAEISYSKDVYPILKDKCYACHSSRTGYVITNDAGADYKTISGYIDKTNPDQSELLQKASGEVSHRGGTVLSKTSQEYQTIKGWIAQGGKNN